MLYEELILPRVDRIPAPRNEWKRVGRYPGNVHLHEISQSHMLGVQDLYKDSTSDVILKIGNQSFPVHKAVLSSKSPVFRSMFANEIMLQRTNILIEVSGIDSDTLHRLLLYIYTDTVNVMPDWRDVEELYAASIKYEIPPLKKKCSELLKSVLHPANVCDILVLADMYQDVELKLEVVKYILMNDLSIIGSATWNKFERYNPALALETLRIVYLKKSQPGCFRVQLFLDWARYKHQSQRALEHSFVMSSSRPPTPYPIFRKSKIAPSEKDEKREEKSDVVEYCKEMLQKSMLTGVPQIVSAPTTRSKVFKTFVVLGSFTGFLYQTSAFLVMYFSYPTLVDVQVTTPPFVDVPALTICNRNGLKRSDYCRMKPENCEESKVLDAFCGRYPESCKDGLVKGSNLFPKMSSRSEEMSATQEMIAKAGHDSYPLVSSCEFSEVNVTFDFCKYEQLKHLCVR
ncbi:uncharacterized protein TNIN_486771 [Trichonephila inaurata madagascariensis]|uniref:BTB domain-containing protein n=1 Tax=Trichonephila inaurata madagascariensis TaxID=2747483 RepID=A0A8X6XGS3_9ARAC|nr:uncharacterized protein TNIN_486771 [Trichonephila inaurata madagascariensis]